MSSEIPFTRLPLKDRLSRLNETYLHVAETAESIIVSAGSEKLYHAGAVSDTDQKIVQSYWERSVRFPRASSLEKRVPGTVKGRQSFGVQLAPVTIDDIAYIRRCAMASASFANFFSDIEHFDPADYADWFLDQQRNVFVARGTTSGEMYFGTPEPKFRYYPYLAFVAEHIKDRDPSLVHFLYSDQRNYAVVLEELDPVEQPHISLVKEYNSTSFDAQGRPVQGWVEGYSFRNADFIVVTSYVAASGRPSVMYRAAEELQIASQLLKRGENDNALYHEGLWQQRVLLTHLTKNGSFGLTMQHMNVIQDVIGLPAKAHGLLDFIAIYSQPAIYGQYHQDYARGFVSHF